MMNINEMEYEDLVEYVGNSRWKVNAKFIGKDGSMGFRNGRTYRIKVIFHGNPNWVEVRYASVYCPYDSLSALVKNWDFKKD